MEHFDTSNNSLGFLVFKTNDFNFIVEFELSTLNSTCSNSTTTGNCEYIFNRHKERLISFSVRSGDVTVNCFHEFNNRSISRIARIGAGALESGESRALNDRCIVAGELVLIKSLTNFHLNEFEEFGIVNLIALVHEYYDVGNANLTGKEKMLLGLSHRAVSCSDNEDSAVHLSSTGNHVLDIVGMSGAVNVSIVTVFSLILNMSGVDCDSTLSLFRSLINHVVCFVLSLT